MLNEAIPRLVVHLRPMFPDAKIELLIGENMPDRASDPRPDSAPFRLSLSMRNYPEWLVISETIPLSNSIQSPRAREDGGFQYLESSLRLRFPQLEQINNNEFLKLLTFENLGLRGLTLTEGKLAREIVVRTGFVAQMGRTLDETENLAIDCLSLLRFAKILKDRITRSSVDGKFFYEMYRSQYLAVGHGRIRYINYARSIFQGSTERVFGQMQAMLKHDFAAECVFFLQGHAKVSMPHLIETGRKIEFSLRVPGDIPGEVPMVTCDSPLMIHRANQGAAGMVVLPGLKMMEVAARLNRRPEIRTEPGHFEVSADGAFLTYASWKHLTNDIHLFSLDYIVTGIARAEGILREELVREGHQVEIKSNSDVKTKIVSPPPLARRAA